MISIPTWLENTRTNSPIDSTIDRDSPHVAIRFAHSAPSDAAVLGTELARLEMNDVMRGRTASLITSPSASDTDGWETLVNSVLRSGVS